jgi:hypothetical protein
VAVAAKGEAGSPILKCCAAIVRELPPSDKSIASSHFADTRLFTAPAAVFDIKCRSPRDLFKAQRSLSAQKKPLKASKVL